VQDVGCHPLGFSGMAGFAGWAAFEVEAVRFGFGSEEAGEPAVDQAWIGHRYWPPWPPSQLGSDPFGLLRAFGDALFAFGVSPQLFG
jgi:hypothetical protein